MTIVLGWARRSLHHRIVLSVVFGLGVILLLFGLLALWTIQESSQSSYQERVTLAGALAQRVTDILEYEFALLQGEADHLNFRPGVPLGQEQRSALAALHEQMGTVAILSLTDGTGTTLWTEPSRADIIIGGPLRHPSVQLALATGQPQVSELPPLSSSNTTFACLAVPLRDTGGHLMGVLMAEVDPGNQALNFMPSSDLMDRTHAQLVNVAGTVLAGSPSPYASDAAEHHALLSGLMAARMAGYRLHALGGSLGFGGHLVAYAPVALLPTWGVVIEQPRDLVVAAPHQLAERLGGFGLLALALAAVVAWSDVSRVVRPVKHLTTAAQRFAGGQLGTPVGTRYADRPDEVGILARSFETMRQQLSASLHEIAAWNQELERRVAERTAEVEARSRELSTLYARLQARERERAELLQRSMAGQEEERRRLAQELHDETSQALASLRLGLERLAGGATAPDEAQQLALHLQDVASQTLAAVHRLAVELRPSILDDVGLVAAVERYLQEYAQRSGLAVDFEPVGADGFRLIPAAETAVYRIIQGALTNVIQHAQAQHVSVLLERRDGQLVVVVEDDGRGFDLEAVRAGPLDARLGLAGMDERAALIGAALTIEAAPGAGSTVFLEVPFDLNVRKEETHGEAADRPR